MEVNYTLWQDLDTHRKIRMCVLEFNPDEGSIDKK